MMNLISFFQQVFPPASTFSIDDIPDLHGKVMIVTGASTGIGKETAKALLIHNAKVYIATRSQEKAEQAIIDLKDQTGKEAHFLKLDLADLNSIKAAAEEFQSREQKLHVLFNNGGVFVPPLEQTTAQGYDLQFGTNTLGHFCFTKHLLPMLLLTARSSAPGTVRIINTSSFAHSMGTLNFNTFKDSSARREMSIDDLYAQSKLGNIVFSNELARRYGGQGIVSVSLHPGFLRSDVARHLQGIKRVVYGLIMHHPPAYGALTQLWAGTSTEGANLNGQYLIPWARMGEAAPLAQDRKIATELWKWFEEQVTDI
ncbi:hypothetical protein BDQ12DRAFT_770851 [Crucibulum laeve]|uniref:NAD(P)-binding protein n=1 Tax=Crucibulum laeve TaxID=68775 RepID=A0A5C3M8Q2_9AGAR|nr:hypothetical protein BDQ12DRAFT_770851 [Crucibulum laeve]